MKLDYTLNDLGVDELRISIIKNTAKQHRFLLRRRGRSVKLDRLLNDEIKEVERFLRSSWGQLLSGDCGDYIIEMDYKVVNEELERERRKKK